jgi:hypothetical protein
MIYGNTNSNTPLTTVMLSDITIANHTNTSVKHQLERLLEMIDSVVNYIEAVKNGTIQGNIEIGYILLNILNKYNITENNEIQSIISNKKSDIVMLSYVTSLIGSQLEISNRLLQIL